VFCYISSKDEQFSSNLFEKSFFALQIKYIIISLHVTSPRTMKTTSLTSMKEMLHMKCSVLKSNEDMILALAGQFKQLSHEPEKFR